MIFYHSIFAKKMEENMSEHEKFIKSCVFIV